jgi:hypothetical protein
VNELKGKHLRTSHLISYIDKINNASLAPKSFSLVKRKPTINTIDCHDQVVNKHYAKPLGEALGQAKYVNMLNLRNTSLTDESAIAILSKMDRSVVTHIDISENPNLTAKFYDFLAEKIVEIGTNLRCLELEKNPIDYISLEKVCQALIDADLIQMLNLSQCGIDDRSSRLICNLIKDANKLRMLFLSHNKLLGPGG